MNGIIIHAISEVLRNVLWSGQGFKSQQCCHYQAGPRIEDLFAPIPLVVLDGAVTHPSSMLSHRATEGRQHYQILLSASYLYMLPVVLSGLCESLKSRCSSAQQKMPENTRVKGKADLVKARWQSRGWSDLHLLSIFPRNGTLWPALSKAEVALQDRKVTINLRSCPCTSVIFHYFVSSFTPNHDHFHNGNFSANVTMKLPMAIASWVYRTVRVLKWKTFSKTIQLKGLLLPEWYRPLLCHYTRSQTSCYPLLHFL